MREGPILFNFPVPMQSAMHRKGKNVSLPGGGFHDGNPPPQEVVNASLAPCWKSCIGLGP